MSTGYPFIHRFGREGQRYIYDCNTNKILGVGELQYELLPVFEGNEGNIKPAIIEQLKQRYGQEVVASAITRIKDAQKSGLFSSKRPVRKPLPFNRDDVERKISSGIGSMSLSITERCNLRCRYCVYSGAFPERRHHSLKTMSFDTAKHAIDFLVSHSRESEYPPALSFFGGEPLLVFPLVKKCIEYFRSKTEKDSIISITTNGALLSQEVVECLQNERVYINVSLDGPKEIHDAWRIRRDGTGSFNLVNCRLKMIKGSFPDYWKNHFGLFATIVPPVDLSVLADFFDSEIVKYFRSTPVEDYGADIGIPGEAKVIGLDALAEKFAMACCNSTFNTRVDGHLPLPFTRNFFSIQMRKIHCRPQTPLGEVSDISGVCIPGVHKLFVSVDGNFFICEKTEGCAKALIGDVHQGISMDRVNRILDEFEALDWCKCSDCWLVRMCPVCYLHVIHGERWDKERLERSCAQIRGFYSFCLQLYCDIMEKDMDALDFLNTEDHRPSS